MSYKSTSRTKPGNDLDNPLATLIHIFGISAFAIAQPFYALISANTTFLTAHNATPLDTFTLVIGVSFLLPMILFGTCRLIALFSVSLGHAVTLALICLLATLAILPLAKGLSGNLLPLAAALVSGTCFAYGYLRFQGLRQYLGWLAVAGVILPLWFLFGTQVRTLLIPRDPPAVTIPNNGTPVVLIVFDELPLTSLTTVTKSINRDWYPNFAALADTAHWFRNASTVSDFTNLAVPAILTGKYPHFQTSADGRPEAPMPIKASYPNNLFALLSGSHRTVAYESVTSFVRGQQNPQGFEIGTWKDRTSLLWLDSAIVYLNIVRPSGLLSRLPSTEGRWSNFANVRASTSNQNVFLGFQYHEARVLRTVRFINSLQASSQPALYYLHTLLPHSPFVYLPSGRNYMGQPQLPHGMGRGSWSDDPWEAIQGYQRHLLQVAFADRVLGEVTNRLKAVDLFDSAVIIVVGDHGASFRENTAPRGITKDNAPDTMLVPLFIKTPRQTAGQVSDTPAEIIDVLPTLARILEAEPGWQYDGIDLFDTAVVRQSRRVFARSGASVDHEATIPGLQASLQRKAMIFDESDPSGAYELREHQDLLHRSCATLPIVPEVGPKAEVDNTHLLRTVQLQNGFVPAHIRGRLIGSNERNQTLAICLNGLTAAITHTYGEDGINGHFTALLRDSSFKDGENKLELYLMQEAAEGVGFRRIVVQRGDQSQLHDTQVRFTKASFPTNHVISGLGHPEETLTWSNAGAVHMEFRLPNLTGAVELSLDAYPFIKAGYIDEQRVTVQVNGIKVGEWRFNERKVARRTLTIPLGLIRPAEPFILTFELPDAAVPADLGVGADQRMLAIAFIAIAFASEP